MSRKPNDPAAQKTGTGKPRQGKPKAAGKKPRKPITDVPDEETPITVSGGSIVISSVFDREDTDGKNHKHCKIKDAPGRKWKPIRVEIDDDRGDIRYALVGDGAVVRVIFSRPAP